MKKTILVIPGDGIGVDVIKEAIKVLNTICNVFKFDAILDYASLGGEAYDKFGTPFPEDTIKKAKQSDAILLGAVGGPKWESLDYSLRPERGLLGIRKELDLFANLRPAKVFECLKDSSTLKPEIVSNLDIMIIRELTGGIYFGNPRGVRTLENGEKQGFNTATYTESEISRIAKIAFEVASVRSKKVCSVDKANVLEVTELWRDVVAKEAKNFPQINLTNMYVDNAAMQLVRNPKQFDVIVTSNLFGDILSDIASMLTGSLGMLPSASLGQLRPDGKRYALYEPVHGSAPDIAGRNIANPIATILSLAMMFKYSFSREDIYKAIENAVQKVLSQGWRTADIFDQSKDEPSKKASTTQMGDLIASQISKN